MASLTWVNRLRERMGVRLQLVALVAGLAALVAVALVAVVWFTLDGQADRVSAQVLSDRAETVATGIDAASSSTHLRVPRALLGPGVAVYDADGGEVDGSVPPSLMDEFAALSRVSTPRTVEIHERYEIVARPFRTSHGLHGVIVVTEPWAPYEHTARAATVVSMVAGGLLVLVAAASAAWISKRVLSPVEQMARTAEEWSQHDLERRFALGPPTNEIRALGHTLDELLERVAHVIRAEQRLTAELAHELRTPLTTIQGMADLLAMRTDLDEEAREDVTLIKSAAAGMTQSITVLLDVARREAAGGHGDRTSLDEVGAELETLYSGRVDDLDIRLDEHLYVAAPAALVVRAVAPLVDNALAASAQVSKDVRIRSRRRGRTVELVVEDAGTGVAGTGEDLFTPGWSGSGGSGLGLSLARRVARSAGGDVRLDSAHNERGGATFVVTLPGGVVRSETGGEGP